MNNYRVNYKLIDELTFNSIEFQSDIKEEFKLLGLSYSFIRDVLETIPYPDYIFDTAIIIENIDTNEVIFTL